MAWDLRQARIFVSVAESLHFGKAAQKLNIAQSAVSRAIAWMERDLNVRLLERDTRHVALTAEGALLLEECQRIVAQFDHSIERSRAISQGLAGEIDIGCNDFALLAELPGIVRRFHNRHPSIAVRLHEGHRDGQVAAMMRGELDLSFVIGPIEIAGFASVTTRRHRLCVVMGNRHPLARRKTVRIGDLAAEPFVLGNREGWETYRTLLDGMFNLSGFRPRVEQEVYGSLGIFELVSAGIGVTVYPDCLASLRHRHLTMRPISDAPLRLENVIIWDPAALTRAARYFLDFVLADLGLPANAVMAAPKTRARVPR
ncbi:MAG TPA: LysR family transcriptional regulator [Dongiaceae bacterium]|nr:LysR family transcriptional regulator [Dongiaceae bacterium]